MVTRSLRWLFTCLWFQEWYTIWPLALAAFLPAGSAIGLAILLNYAALTNQLIFGPLWLWQHPLPPWYWIDRRLGPAVLAAPWLYLLLILALRTRRGLQSVRLEGRFRRSVAR